MNRILTISIASTLVLASITGAALAKGGDHDHDHGGQTNGGRGFASHTSITSKESGGNLPWHLTNGNEGATVR